MTAILVTLFRALAFVCPPEFRREYAVAMQRDFEEALRNEASARGPFAAASVAASGYADLLAAAVSEFSAMLYRDLVFAFRSMRKTPLFAGIIVATLAIAIGTNAMVFSIVRAVILAPLPYAQGDRLIAIEGLRDGKRFSLSLPDFRDLQRQARLTAEMAAFSGEEAVMTGRGEARKLEGTSATVGLFEMLRVRPELGRFPTLADARPGASKSVVISHTFWRQSFAGDAGAIGATLTLDGRSYRVIGVAPDAFRQPNLAGDFSNNDYWLPLPEVPPTDDWRYQRGAHNFEAIGRLRDGASVDGASRELATIFAGLIARYPIEDKRHGVRALSLIDELVGNVRPLFIAISAAVAGVLLIACANVANLLLSRAATRDRELAVRVAVGASRGRIVVQLLTETFVLAIAGGALGAVLAAFGVHAFVALHPPEIPRVADVSFDGTEALFAFAIVVLVTFAAGLTPALILSTRDVAASLKSAGRSSDAGPGRSVRRALVVCEVALTMALVVAAGLVVRSFVTLTNEPLGFDASGVFAVGEIDLPEGLQATSVAASDAFEAQFFERVLTRVYAIPGVRDAAFACCAPFSREQFNLSFTIAGRPVAPGEAPSSRNDVVSPDYFRLMHVATVRGRTFDARDRRGAPDVIVVNVAFAEQFFPGISPLGKRIAWGGASPSQSAAERLRTIVGVVSDTRDSYAKPQAPLIYLPVAQEPLNVTMLYVRAPETAAHSVADAIANIDPLLPRPTVVPFSRWLERDSAQARLTALTLGFLALVALALSVAGIFAVVSYGVEQRTREFGIRMALGARASTIVRGVVGEAMRTALGGVFLGLVLAGAATRFLADQLYDTAPLDPLTFAAVTLLIGIATLGASFLPARRATRVDPIVALRYE